MEVQEGKVKAKYEQIDTWMLDNDIPEKIKTEVVKIIKYQKAFERNYAAGVDVDVDLVFVFSAITTNGNRPIASNLKEHFCVNALKKVCSSTCFYVCHYEIGSLISWTLFLNTVQCI